MKEKDFVVGLVVPLADSEKPTTSIPSAEDLMSGKVKIEREKEQLFKTAEAAYYFALDNGSSEETRNIVCTDPFWALEYALDVDKGPRDDTRKACCQDPAEAYYYALSVDKGPREDTRTACLKDPEYAFYYSVGVDKCPREDTRKAVQGSAWETEYNRNFPSEENPLAGFSIEQLQAEINRRTAGQEK